VTSGRHHRRGIPGCTGRRGGPAFCSCERLGPTLTELPADIEQLELPIGDYIRAEYVEGTTIQQRFQSFHTLNPWVLESLEKLTEDWLRRGRRRLGIGMLTEVLRWQHGRRTIGDEFRLNNNYRSRYVRLMIERHPEWADVFETRELKSA
jgi:hypothetical protein